MADVTKVSQFLRQDGLHSKIVGVGSVESSFLVQCCCGINSFDDEDLAPLLVFMECLTALEVKYFTCIFTSMSVRGGRVGCWMW